MGGRFQTNSFLNAAYREDYSVKEGIVRQMLTKIAGALNPERIDPTLYLLHKDPYSRFVRTIRYLGGRALPANIGDFLTSNDETAPFYEDGTNPAGYSSNPQAVFAGFVGNNTFNNIKTLGNGDLMSGYAAVREFISENYSGVSIAFQNIAETFSFVCRKRYYFLPLRISIIRFYSKHIV